MKKLTLWHLLLGIFMAGACATVPRTANPYFEMPPDHLLQAERELFSLDPATKKITSWNLR